MADTPFIGRKQQLKDLEDLITFNNSSLAVLKGRRRIGKSRLAREFAKDKIFLRFSGISPLEGATAQGQRNKFSEKLAHYCNEAPILFERWDRVFDHLAKHIKSIPVDKQVVILFDEISWIGSLDPEFIPLFKDWWDEWDALPHEPYARFVLILCGSVSTWIEEKIINSTALHGRINLQLTLTDLSLPEAHQFLLANEVKGSTIDTVKILSVTGGVPWYLKQIKATLNADENIKALCFQSDGLFVKEYKKIFHDLFGNKGSLYKQVLQRLAKGMCDVSELKRHFHDADSDNATDGTNDSDSLNKTLQNLIIAGFVSPHYSWKLQTGTIEKQHYIYSLSDNYMRFYLKYISPNLEEIQNNTYEKVPLSQISGWQAMMGFQVENLIVKNRHALVEALGLFRVDIVRDNPYIQRAVDGAKGCQIDYLIQTKSKNLYVCEFKFNKNEFGVEVIQSVKEKIDRFVVPEGFGVKAVLVHIGGVSKAVHDKRYFHRIINIAELL